MVGTEWVMLTDRDRQPSTIDLQPSTIAKSLISGGYFAFRAGWVPSRRALQPWRSGAISMLKNACHARFFPVPSSLAEALHNPWNQE
jgi:hypothetical protein